MGLGFAQTLALCTCWGAWALAAHAQSAPAEHAAAPAAGVASKSEPAKAAAQPIKMRYSQYLKTYGAPLKLEVKDLIPRSLAQVLVYPQAVTLGSLDVDALAAQHQVNTIIFLRDVQMQGNLIQPESDFGPTLVFQGNLTADSAFFGGSWVEIAGNLTVHNLLVGDYNHGALRVGGQTQAYMVYNSDHSMSFGKKLTARYHLGSDEPNTLSHAQASQLFIAPVWQALHKSAEGDPHVFGVATGEIFLPYLARNQNPLQRPDLAKAGKKQESR